jgi:thioredoxin 1
MPANAARASGSNSAYGTTTTVSRHAGACGPHHASTARASAGQNAASGGKRRWWRAGKTGAARRAAGHAAMGFVSESLCLGLDGLSAAARREPTMSSELITHVSDASFEGDVLKSDKPVLVDYWAEWCGPCKMIAPILDEVSKDYDGRLRIAKMNVDDNREVPARFGIRGIPTLMLFKDGQLAATKVGALSKAQLTAFLDGHL